MEPVVTNSASNTCDYPISSNCVTVSEPVPGVQGVCFPANLTQILSSLGSAISGESAGLGSVIIPGINLGCLYNTTVGTCPAGWTFVPATATVAAHCSNGCPPGSIPTGTNPDGSILCTYCPLGSPCPPPVPIYIPNPTPAPTTLAGILQLMINAIPCCNPCISNTTNQSANSGCPPGVIC